LTCPREHHFGADQRPGEVGAEYRDDQPRADELPMQLPIQ
jgi:hypothetical protein